MHASALLAYGCSSSSPSLSSSTFPSAPLTTLATSGGGLTVEVRSLPNQPPVSGAAEIQYAIRDDAGVPVTGLTLAVVPWMPAMGHGDSATATVVETPADSGIYVATGIDFIMSGEWELKTTISGPVTDSVNPEFNVQ